jgi:hypothetical protein
MPHKDPDPAIFVSDLKFFYFLLYIIFQRCKSQNRRINVAHPLLLQLLLPPDALGLLFHGEFLSLFG